MIFRLQDVCKEFGTQILFRGVSCQCNAQDRIGLIGRNGCGKTTLFDLIEGRLDPDQGQLHRASGLTTARIPQRPGFEPGNTVLQEALKVFEHLAAVEKRLGQLESEMAASRSHKLPAGLAEEYESLQMQMRLKGGYGYRARTESVLLGIGFSAQSLQSPWEHLSGGQQNRLMVAQTLLAPSDLLLLDEPTNHLDLEAIFWLTGYLSSLSSAYLVISHDRRFLDQVTEQTWEIEGRCLHRYSGSFSAARQQRLQRLEQQRKAYDQQQEWKARTQDFVRRNIVGQKTKQAQARRRQLEKTEWLEAPLQDNAGLRLRIQEGRRGGALSFQIQKGQLGYAGGTVLLKDVDLAMRRGERIGIVGGNGTGKSTLLNTIAGEQPLLSGSLEWGPNNDLAYFSQNPWLGEGAQSVYDSLREKDPFSSDEELRSFAALFLFRGDDVFKPVQALSGGERSRLALARLVHEPANILLMDEPTNHLDIVSSEALEEMLQNYQGTLLVVSHDLYFLDKVVDQFFLIREQRLQRLESLSQISFGQDAPAKSTRPEPRQAPSPAKPRASKNEVRRMRQKVEKLEARVEELEAHKASLEESLKLPGHPYEELHRLSEHHQQIEKELSGLYGKWEKQAHALSEMEG